ncbi:MAG: hypothetical protein WA709_18485 [Stellaceae bacterium]
MNTIKLDDDAQTVKAAPLFNQEFPHGQTTSNRKAHKALAHWNCRCQWRAHRYLNGRWSGKRALKGRFSKSSAEEMEPRIWFQIFRRRDH